jgi:hypothetical protein
MGKPITKRVWGNLWVVSVYQRWETDDASIGLVKLTEDGVNLWNAQGWPLESTAKAPFLSNGAEYSLSILIVDTAGFFA